MKIETLIKQGVKFKNLNKYDIKKGIFYNECFVLAGIQVFKRLHGKVLYSCNSCYREDDKASFPIDTFKRVEFNFKIHKYFKYFI